MRRLPIDYDEPIHPHGIYRVNDYGEKFFGYGKTSIDAKIEAGLIPKPFALDDSTSTKKGGTRSPLAWFGRTILEHHAWREARANGDTKLTWLQWEQKSRAAA